MTSVSIVVAWIVIRMRDLWYLAAFLLALVVVAVVVAILVPAMSRFRVHLSASTHLPVVGDDVDLHVSVQATTMGSPTIDITWMIDGRPDVAPVRCAPGRREVGSSRRWTPSARGPATISVSRLSWKEPLGIAVRRIGVRASLEFLVLPRYLPLLLHRLNDTHLFAAIADGSSGRSAQFGGDVPSGAVRDYRTGDAMRQIHWKHSARHGELLVSVPEESSAPECSLRLVTDERAYSCARDFEIAVSAAATVVDYCQRLGHPVRLGIGSAPPHVMSSEVDALRALALATLTRDVPAADRVDAAQHVLVTGTLTSQVLDEVHRTRSTPVILAREVASDVEVPTWSVVVPIDDEDVRDG